MKYKRPHSFDYAVVVRKALKSFNKNLQAHPVEKADGKEDKSKKRNSNRKWTQDKGIFWATAVLTVGTFLLFLRATQQNNEIREEFKIANTPYLQLTNVIDSIHPGQSPMISYSIENLGKVPCKIIWVELADSIDNQPRRINFLGLPSNEFASSQFQNRSPVNRYSIEGSPYQSIYIAGYGIDSNVYADLKSKKSFHHFYGIVGYINQMSGDERIYEFRAKIIQRPAGAIEMLTNDNWPIDDYRLHIRVWINE